MTPEQENAIIQSTLGFETLDKAAALGLETATPLTDLRQYINSNLRPTSAFTSTLSRQFV